MKVREVMKMIDGENAKQMSQSGGSGECDRREKRSVTVERIMSNLAHFCYEGEAVSSVIKTMEACGLAELLVRDSMGRVVGVVCKEEILAAAPEVGLNSQAEG